MVTEPASAGKNTASGSPDVAAPSEATVQAAQDVPAGKGHVATHRAAEDRLADAQGWMWGAHCSTGMSETAGHSPALGSGLVAGSMPDQAPCQPQQDASAGRAIWSPFELGQLAGAAVLWQLRSDSDAHMKTVHPKRRKVSLDPAQASAAETPQALAAKHAPGSDADGSRAVAAAAPPQSLPCVPGSGTFTFKDGLRALKQGMEGQRVPASTQSCPAPALRPAVSAAAMPAPPAQNAISAGPVHGKAFAALSSGNSGMQSSIKHAPHHLPSLPASESGQQLLHDSQDSVASGTTAWGQRPQQDPLPKKPYSASPGKENAAPKGRRPKASGQRQNDVQSLSTGSRQSGVVQTPAASRAAGQLGSMPAAPGGQGSLLRLACLQQLVRFGERSRVAPCEPLPGVAPLHAMPPQLPVLSHHSSQQVISHANLPFWTVSQLKAELIPLSFLQVDQAPAVNKPAGSQCPPLFRPAPS